MDSIPHLYLSYKNDLKSLEGILKNIIMSLSFHNKILITNIYG